jgi:hypothetical protein
MTPQARPRSINDIMPMIGARFYNQLEMSHIRTDILENELSKVCVVLSVLIQFLYSKMQVLATPNLLLNVV